MRRHGHAFSLKYIEMKKKVKTGRKNLMCGLTFSDVTIKAGTREGESSRDFLCLGLWRSRSLCFCRDGGRTQGTRTFNPSQNQGWLCQCQSKRKNRKDKMCRIYKGAWREHKEVRTLRRTCFRRDESILCMHLAWRGTCSTTADGEV